jgi:hypothetical protein
LIKLTSAPFSSRQLLVQQYEYGINLERKKQFRQQQRFLHLIFRQWQQRIIFTNNVDLTQ